MIVQQINLYQPRFRPTTLWLSATHMMLLGVVLLVLLLATSLWLQQRFEAIQSHQQSLLLQQQQAGEKLQKLQARLQAELENNKVEQEVEQLSNAISARKKLIQFVESNQFDDAQGFSAYLAGLAEIKIDDIWLSEIRLAQHDVRLSGSALKAEQIPDYFSRLRNSRMFGGRRFDLFEVNRSKAREWKVDFQISTGEDPHE